MRRSVAATVTVNVGVMRTNAMLEPGRKVSARKPAPAISPTQRAWGFHCARPPTAKRASRAPTISPSIRSSVILTVSGPRIFPGKMGTSTSSRRRSIGVVASNTATRARCFRGASSTTQGQPR